MTKVFLISMIFACLLLPGVSAAGNLTDNGNGTVSDSGTHLMWQQGESDTMTWDEAISYCKGLSLAGYTDWRLPSSEELSSLVDDSKISRLTINTTVFPNAKRSSYWSSTSSTYGTPNAWCVYFGGGNMYYFYKTYPFYARCVRGGR